MAWHGSLGLAKSSPAIRWTVASALERFPGIMEGMNVMTTLLSRPASFEGFGPSVLSKQIRGELTGHLIPNERLEARKLLRTECPSVPGVYGWLDSNRQLVYVGKSKALRSRLLTYFAKNPSDHKMLRIRQHSEQLVWEPVSHELLALIREQELIHRWRPDFNKQGQPTRTQPAFLCISGGPAPNAFLARKTSSRTAKTFGPISGTNRLRQAIISLNQAFRLRDCPDKTKFEFNNQQTLFDDPATAKCIRYELGSCPAPCAGMCSAKGYQKNVQRAMDFLEGRDRSILTQTRARYVGRGRNQAFEVAAVLRDYLDQLTLARSTTRITSSRANDAQRSRAHSNPSRPQILVDSARWPPDDDYRTSRSGLPGGAGRGPVDENRSTIVGVAGKPVGNAAAVDCHFLVSQKPGPAHAADEF